MTKPEPYKPKGYISRRTVTHRHKVGAIALRRAVRNGHVRTKHSVQSKRMWYCTEDVLKLPGCVPLKKGGRPVGAKTKKRSKPKTPRPVTPKGVRCPKCSSIENIVDDTIKRYKTVHRVRLCRCGNTFKTKEVWVK